MFLRVACLWAPHRDCDLPVIRAVEGRIFRQGPHDHPDQVRYIITWKNLVEYSPTPMKAFLSPRLTSKVLAIRKKETLEEGTRPEKKLIL